MPVTERDRPYRVGLIVPSSNVTLETELPRMLERHPRSDSITVHSSRAVMRDVTADSLRSMVEQLERCTEEILDIEPDVVLYGCLVAVMAAGPRAHLDAESTISEIAARRGLAPTVASSAGALVRCLERMAVSKIAVLMPYTPPLAETVIGYVEGHGVEVSAWHAFGVADNRSVGSLPQEDLLGRVIEMDLNGAEAVVISACVQMPSLDVVQTAEDALGVPVLSAATAGVYEVLSGLGGKSAGIPGAGALLGPGSLPEGGGTAGGGDPPG